MARWVLLYKYKVIFCIYGFIMFMKENTDIYMYTVKINI